MIVDDQKPVIELLTTPSTYGGDVDHVDRIDTHSSTVFLVGDLAYKLKRAVRYDYLDFSTPERRRALCDAELALNRRTAPQLYLDVLPITREADGRLVLSGAGDPIDWVLRMRRFDQNGLFDRLAGRGSLDLALMQPLAAAIAELHEGADPRTDHGGRAGMAWVVDGNAEGFAEQGAGILDPEAAGRVTALARAALGRHGRLLEARRRDGFVRACHGDLHLRNIVLIDGQPTIFDGVEFNDRISCIDVLYDLAFLLMDLWRLDLRAHANAVFNEYLEHAGQHGALGLMPLFLSCRSAVRAKTNATAARLQPDTGRAADLEASASQYLGLAERLLQPPSPQLVAVGGLSGTGKTTLARLLAASIGPVPGAVVLRSDVLRKSLFGVSATTRLGPEGYTEEVSRRVYELLAARARDVLDAGHGVVVDAVYRNASEREALSDVARSAGVRFTGLWLEAPLALRADRVDARAADASDATAEIVRRQVGRLDGAGGWERVDASGTPDDVRRRAEAVLGRTANAAP